MATRALSSFTLPEQRLILALVRLHESPAIPVAPSTRPRRKAPKMMPGQEPYTPAELTTLYGMVADAAAGDPGEANEPGG